MENLTDRPANRLGFVQRELDRIAVTLVETTDPERYGLLYAAQQALSWSLEPNGLRSPFNMIMGIPVEPADCSVDPRPAQSSETCSPNKSVE